MNKMMLSAMLIGLFACTKADDLPVKKEETTPPPTKRHEFGGWYCPDNLFGFPAVNMRDWNSVPVITDRLPTQEETKTEASLIYIDPAKHPTARVLPMSLPRLATYYTEASQKKELVIIIQAIEVEGDSIVGFRYLNGGNGSAHYREVAFLSEQEISQLPDARFVHVELPVQAPDEQVWRVLTVATYRKPLQAIYSMANIPSPYQNVESKINYQYPLAGSSTAAFADKLWGCYYVQNDFNNLLGSYVEKILLRPSEDRQSTTLKITFGPYTDDANTQQAILTEWAEKVKQLSEQK